LLACACGLAGCLPAGDPPAGRHLIKERTLSGVFLSPSEQDGVPSYVLATGPVSSLPSDPAATDVKLADVYLFSDSPQPVTIDGLVGGEPLFEGMHIPGTDPTSHTFATDFRGRLLFVKWNSTASPGPVLPFELWRLDLNTGRGEVLASAPPDAAYLRNSDPRLGLRTFRLSPARTQVFAGYFGAGWLIGPTRVQFLLQAHTTVFVGEDFYCAGLTSADESPSNLGSNVLRVAPDADAETLLSSTGQLGLVAITGDFFPQLLLSLQADAGYAPFALLDTDSLKSTPLPTERGQASFASVSPDGRYLLFETALAPGDPVRSDHRLFIFDWMANALEVIDSARIGKDIGAASEWRPGTSELWLTTLPDGFAVWKPGGGVTTYPATLCRYAAPFGQLSSFTPDGRYWFSLSPNQGGRPTISVGLADNPTLPSLPLNPAGTATDRYWPIDDGRLLVEAYASDNRRSDIYLVDPDAGTSRALGSAGKVVAAGHTRALALLNWQLSRASGQLTLIDYESGAHTLLAEDVYAVDVDRGRSAIVPPGTDALLSGTRVAFLCRNRLVSRDDGLWVTELP
jgi:hypothetical protein